MAQASAKLTYDSSVKQKDYLDVITNISPKDTPYLSSFGKEKVEDVYKRWPTDSLVAAADNANIEGSDYSFTKPADRSETGNYTQIFVTPVEVSETQRSVKVNVGVKDELSYQVAKKMKEHARDIEKAIVEGTGNSGASGTARRLKGVLSWIETNVGTGTGSGTGTAGDALTSTDINDVLEDIWQEGGDPDCIDANGTQKRVISTMTTTNTKNIDVSEKKVVERVDVYESDFGMVQVKLQRFLPQDTIVMRTTDYWKLGFLRNTKVVDVAKVGDADRKIIRSELTLLSLQEKASGKVTGLEYTP